MSTLGKIVRAIRGRPAGGDTAGAESLRRSAKALDRDLSGLRELASSLTTRVDRLQIQLDQLAELQRGELATSARLERLERVLDRSRIAAHVRQAIANARVIDDPVAYAVIADVLPDDVYRAVVEAIPAPVFFDGDGVGGRELKVPPTLAPVDSIALWTFLAEIADAAFAPALVERFGDALARRVEVTNLSADGRQAGSPIVLTAGAGRIVRRRPGGQVPSARPRSSYLLTLAIDLAHSGDGEDYGSRLDGGRIGIPFHGNTALAVVDPGGTHEYEPIPDTAPADTVRHVYELRFR